MGEIRGRRLKAGMGSALLLGGLMSAGAMANTVTLTGVAGNNAMTQSYQAVGGTSSTPVYSGTDYSLAVPGQYSFTDTFSSQQTVGLGTTSFGAYDFQDSYQFTVSAGAQGDTLVAQLGLPPTFSISNLQFRLYQVTAANPLPAVGAIPAGDTVFSPWLGLTAAQIAAGQTSITASFTGLQAGATYMLDIAGIASGTNGGLYVGSLNLAPVPLPAALWLMVSGLGGLGAMVRRRRADELQIG